MIKPLIASFGSKLYSLRVQRALSSDVFLNSRKIRDNPTATHLFDVSQNTEGLGGIACDENGSDRTQ